MIKVTEKAIDTLKLMASEETDAYRQSMLNFGIYALEKRVPKAVTVVIPKGGRYLGCIEFYRCPSCEYSVDKQDPYCKVCGQKLDWITEKEDMR